MLKDNSRGVSPVIGAVLMLGVVVVIAAAAGVFVFGLAGNQDDPSPNVYRYTEELTADTAGSDDQFLRITHKGGETIGISEVDIDILVAVEGATCNGQVRLTNPTASNIDAADFEGDDILDEYGLAGKLGTGSEENWKSGDKIEIRIASSKCSLQSGDKVNIKVVHDPSKSIIIDSTLTADTT